MLPAVTGLLTPFLPKGMELTPDSIQAWVLPYLPSSVLLLLIRVYMKWFGRIAGDPMATVKQIHTDRVKRPHRPVTTKTEEANEQHYGNDPKFFLDHLGKQLKYSGSEWPSPGSDPPIVAPATDEEFSNAELKTLRLYQEKLKLSKLPAGSRVLEMGCGWGSLSLLNAKDFPKLKFVSFSNSPQQIAFIKAEAKKRGIKNLTAMVEDYADFCKPANSKVAPPGDEGFDCAIAVETLEHAQNISKLLEGVALRLKPGAIFFVQSLLHQQKSWLMDNSSWMGRNFFSGGSILSLNSYYHLCPESMHLANVEPINGCHYAKTLITWLDRLEKSDLLKTHPDLYHGFRLFYIVCVAAFEANEGNEFMTGYYTFRRRVGVAVESEQP